MAYKITDDCVACGTCMGECPTGAISEGDIYKIAGQPFADSIDVRAYSLGTRVICMKLSCAITA